MTDSYADLLSMAGAASIQRGRDYAARGLVSNIRRRGGVVRATVRGTNDYTVRLDANNAECDCPYASDGNICKHMVAVILVTHPQEDPFATDAPSLADYLGDLSRDELVDLLLEAAAADEKLEHRLTLTAAEARGDVSALRRQVDAILSTRRFLDYYQSIDYARAGRDVVDALADAAVLPITDPIGLISVVERAIGHAAKVIQHADDSSGDIGALTSDLLAVHADACARGHPDALKLARWLIRFTLEEQDIFNIDVRDYATTLGDRGLATYRAAVDQRLAEKPDAFAATYAAERLALLDRDHEAVVRLFGGDLHSPYQHARVAKAMIEIERRDDALTFARLGMDLPPTWQSRPLYDLSATLHSEAGELEEVVGVRMRGLIALPDLQSYAALRDAATKVDQWAQLRPVALTELASRAPHAHVQALLSDDSIEEAWAAATDAKGGGADIGTMRRLVERRAPSHPADVIPYLRAFAEQSLRVTDREHYRECARWLVALKSAHKRSGTIKDFTAYVDKLREVNRRRPAFLDELRRARV